MVEINIYKLHKSKVGLLFMVLSVVVIHLTVVVSGTVNQPLLADTVNGQSIDTPDAQSFLDRYSEVYEKVNFEPVVDSSAYQMLIGNEMDNIKGYELSGKNYIVHLLNCEKSSNSCIFRINGVNTRRLYSSEVKEDNLAKEFNIDGKYKLKINSVEFDYCGDIVYCNLQYPCDLKDSDNGINYNVFGKILKNGTSIGVDNCKEGEFGPAMDSANGLWENYVNRNCQQQHKFYICPNGCKNGACVPPEQELNCNVIDVLDEGETRTYEASLKEYEVSALLVNSDEVKLIVNGELTDLLSESEAYLLKDDTKISIVDIKSQNLAGEVDRVEFCLRVFNECSDSDSGKNFYERGVTEYRKGENQYSNVEICTYTKAGPTTGEIGDSVIESWCEYGEYRVETIPCEFGCKSGACLKSPIDLGGQCGDNICEGNECNTCVQDCGPAQCL
ncbi:hypothetical protein J4418_00355, partial [Candidatus Woesearchaeota archaeon]|nr:hypothetical protein [Candidatus Woesearchaeota archaeon]